MIYKKNIVPILIGLGLLSNQCLAVEADFSGFSRLVAGMLNTDGVQYYGYDSDSSIDKNSLLGLQARVSLNDYVAFTGLGMLHSNEDEDSGVEWLYLTLKPIESLSIKAGKMQTPFFSLSDVLDVGFSYPWVIAPREVYNDFLFKSYDGVDVRYSLVLDDMSLHLETYYGRYEDDIIVNSSKAPTEVDSLYGFITELNWHEWRFRASYHIAEVDVKMRQLEQFESQLKMAGFNDMAKNLATAGTVNFTQLSAQYDSLKNFFKVEYTDTQTEDGVYPSISAFYITAGRNIGESYSTYLTYSQRNDDLYTAEQTIPLGLDPQLDQMAFMHQTIVQSREEDDIRCWTLGGRWDFRPDMALKAEYKNVESEHGDSATLVAEEKNDFGGHADMLLMSWEWVF